jgi:hypothetical protein
MGVLTVNFLANALPLGGNTTGDISAKYDNLFVPSGYVFSIWGIIYILNIIFVVHGFGVARLTSTYQNIGWLYLLVSLLNISWLFAWHYERIELSLIIMLGFLLTLVAIYTNIGIGTTEFHDLDRVALKGTFSIYLAWISVATVANVTVLLVKRDWKGIGLSEEFWTVAVIVLILAITTVMLLSSNDIAFTGVIIWAVVGIIIKETSEGAIRIAGGGAILAILLVIFYTQWSTNNS